jgi:fermentation-respiration switch protein FrsA (DUF1100 family)
MGGITAIASVAVLGDGLLAGADTPDVPAGPAPEVRPRVVAVVADSVPTGVVVPAASRLPGPARTFLAGRLFDAAARTLDGDPRATDPIKVIGLVDQVPLLLIHGDADTTVPIADGRRLAAAAGPGTEHWVVPGADHGRAHATDGEAYEARVTTFLRGAFASVRTVAPIIGAPGSVTDPDALEPGDPDPDEPADPMED